jgi:hypothetical protein
MTLRPNRKLAGILKARILDSYEMVPDGIVVRFADKSTMHVKTGAPVEAFAIEPFRNAAVSGVRQQDIHLALEFDSREQLLRFQTAEASASVLVRDGANSLEYAD